MFGQLGEVAAAVAVLAGVSDDALAGVDGAALGDAVLRLDDVIHRLEAVRVRVTRAHCRSLAWQRDGARSPVRWHRDRRRVGAGQAAREVAVAHSLDALPRTAAAVADGSVTVEQAAIAARARRGLTGDQLDRLDTLVADRGPHASPRELRAAVTDLAHRVAPDDLAARERQAFARRGLRTGRARDGCWWIDARLGVVGGEQVAVALSTLAAPRGADDPRCGQQRRADALTDLAERALRGGDLPIEGGQRPQVTVTAELATLQRRADAGAARLDHTGPVSAAVARRVACDADVHRVITDGASAVLDVGRATRTVTSAQRRALAARDGGCVGCGAPRGWTDAHHIVAWADGGPTDLANLVLLCRTCHTSVHHRLWRITTDPTTGRHHVHRPPRRSHHPHPPRPPPATPP